MLRLFREEAFFSGHGVPCITILSVGITAIYGAIYRRERGARIQYSTAESFK